MSKIEVNESTFISLVEDVREIKGCLLGDEYHPEGMVHKVKENTECIQKLKRRQNKFFAIVGGAWTVFILGITYLFSKS